MPNSQLAEVAQAQHVREVERVGTVPLELVPVGRLLQGQGPAVPVLPEDNDEHVGIGASSWGGQDKGSGLPDSQPSNSGLALGILGGARGARGQVQSRQGQGWGQKGLVSVLGLQVYNSVLCLFYIWALWMLLG